jgi:L-alanine-DL-glutamate epimerase-like enolase superfamily enzyme
MKITRVHATASSQRRDNPIRDALQTLDTRGTCEVLVETDEGITGHGSIYFGRVEKAPHTLAYLVNEVLGPEIIGQDPFMVRGIRDRLWQLTDYHGTVGRHCPVGDYGQGAGGACLAAFGGQRQECACLCHGRVA